MFCMLALVSWAQILIYNKHAFYMKLTFLLLTVYSGWRTWTASMLAIGIGAFFGGVEALLTLTLRVRSAFYICDRAHKT